MNFKNFFMTTPVFALLSLSANGAKQLGVFDNETKNYHIDERIVKIDVRSPRKSALNMFVDAAQKFLSATQLTTYRKTVEKLLRISELGSRNRKSLSSSSSDSSSSSS